ncbi:MAG: hypothetical protein WBK20_07915 [Spirochaetota bacterium]
MKYANFFLSIIFIAACLILYSAPQAQENPEKQFNPLYDAEAVIQRLSYDNFKNIKLLRTAIYNFGGGEQEFNSLVDTYAEASALYFRNEMIASANLFTKNEKDIKEVAMRLAKLYKEQAEKLHIQVIKMGVRHSLKASIEQTKPNPSVDPLISNASYGIKIANDYLVRSKPIDAIYYFRRAKENCFKVYQVLGEQLPEEYKKDIVDNQNKIYIAKEKKN